MIYDIYNNTVNVVVSSPSVLLFLGFQTVLVFFCQHTMLDSKSPLGSFAQNFTKVVVTFPQITTKDRKKREFSWWDVALATTSTPKSSS